MIVSKHRLSIKHWRQYGRRSFPCKNDQDCTKDYNCFFFSDIRDIHDFLEITIYDEDKEHKYQFLGKVCFTIGIFHLLLFLDNNTFDENKEWREKVV